MALCKLWIVQVVSVTGFFYLGAVFTSSIAAAATYNFIANQRPRFQIPHGNLSYYRSPQWEVLYYLKFGIFPFYSTSSPYFNRTQYLDKIRTIKTLIDRRNSKMKYGLDDENTNEAATAAEIDPTVATVVVTDLRESPHQILDLSQSPTLSSSSVAGGGIGGIGGRSSSMEDNKSWNRNVLYYPLTQIKDNLQLVTKLKGKEEDKKKRKKMRTPEKKTGGVGVDEEDVVNEDLLHEMDPALDYFLADGDPSWLRSRVTKQIGTMGSSARGLYSGGSGGGGSGPGLAAEMTVERKVGRKFQTQGWKK